MSGAAYIFDVDGVINSLTTYEPDARVLNKIAGLLKNGTYVAINTGRGYPWVKDYILSVIRSRIPADKHGNIFVAAEMGGVTVEFSGASEHDERSAFSLTPEQMSLVRKVFDDNKTENMEWYEGKVSMATIAKPAGVDGATFVSEVQKIADKLRDGFANERIKINVNPDALDVTTPEAGKWAGAQLIHDWLRRTPTNNIGHFICFGDNASDYEMARFFAQQGHRVTFVFTGKKLGDVEPDSQVDIVKTTSHYSEGTYTFLSKAVA